MALSAGTRLGPYEILALIGAGGMGEVYRARDPRLERTVAAKVLPQEFSRDRDRLRRFEQEARAAGALNHPNILVVYDFGTQDDCPYLISELLEGHTLRHWLRAGPLSERKVLDYAVQTANGLAAAHEKGIAHRDLKPENLFVTRDGRIKILDFGLAKLVERPDGPAADATASTLTAGTQSGVLMGTAGYMSPEQVLGQQAGLASDIFTFGAILYEMLAGQGAFRRATSVETMHAILKEEPPALSTSRRVSPALLRIVERCLDKEPAQRFHSAHDLALTLEALTGTEPVAAAAPAPVTFPRAARAWLVGVLVVALGAGLFWILRLRQPATQHFFPLATSEGLDITPAWAPNSKALAYSAEAAGRLQVFTRGLGSPMSTQVTRLPEDCFSPFWSADGTHIFFLSGQGLWRVGAAGGEPERVLDNTAAATRSPDGRTVAFYRQGALWITSPANASPSKYDRQPFAARNFASYSYLKFSPDGKQIAAWISLLNGKSEFWLLPYPQGEPRAVFQQLSGTPVAREFSWLPDSRRVVFAEPAVYAPEGHLWIGDTQTSRVQPLTSGAGIEQDPAVSPDGRFVAFAAMDSSYDLVEVPLDGSGIRDLVATARNEITGAWSPSGAQYAYVTDRSGVPEIWLKSQQEGWERPLVTQKDFGVDRTVYMFDVVFSPDGQRIAYRRAGQSSEAVWISSLAGDPPVRLAQQPDALAQRGPSWSPDGAWIAYYSSRDGQNYPMKARVGGTGPPVALSDHVGNYPRWSPSGDWVAFLTDAGVHVVSPNGGPTVQATKSRWLVHGWSRDGALLYGLKASEDHELVVVSLDVGTLQERVVSDLGPFPPASALSQRRSIGAFRGFSLAADGKSFMTSMHRIKSDVWLLELRP